MALMEETPAADAKSHDAAAALRRQRQRLFKAQASLCAPDFLQEHAKIFDAYFHTAFASSRIGPLLKINANPYAIVALGGYGRKEQCVHSDVDLLFLFEKKVPRKAEALIRELVYPLWDMGMEVGYAVRTVKESLALGKKDFESLTPLLDARFICGISNVAVRLAEALRETLLKKHGKTVVKRLVRANRNRHFQFGDSSSLLEPHLKEGQGGLRDYHTMLWIARILFDLRTPRELEYGGCLSHREFERLQRALAFIWEVRNRLHLLSGRKWDRLLFENQIALADAMGFKKTDGQEPVEVFLSILHGHMDFIKSQHLRFLYEQGLDRPSGRKKRARPKAGIPGLFVEDDMLYFEAPEQVVKAPALLVQIFEQSLRLKIPLSGEAKRLIQELSPLVEGSSPVVRRSFERILLGRQAHRVLREMLDSGFLSAFIPEFKGVLHRIQYDAYHLFPVDLHLLHTVEALHGFREEATSPDPLLTRLFFEIKNRKRLLWAALLHDIGKGTSRGDHAQKGAVTAQAVMTAKGYSPADAKAVAFLVKEHLFLMKTATRRDLQDEETAIYCARRVKDPERLKMLYLLTAADAAATGPKAWNSWTAALLKDLFLKTLRILERGELASREAMEAVHRKRRALVEAVETPEERAAVAALLEAMSPRYLIAVPQRAILNHIALYRQLKGQGAVWQVVQGKDPSLREITVCAKDRPGLFSMIAGVFTLNGIDILDAQAFTWKNQTALDLFTVKPPPDRLFEKERWIRAKMHLDAVLAGSLDLSRALKDKFSTGGVPRIRGTRRPFRVSVDNAGSSFFTLIEVVADDFPGLLYGVSDAIFRCGLDIRVAKIATKVDQVVDVFYVRDLEGQKADTPAQEARIRSALEAALKDPLTGKGGIPPVPPGKVPEQKKGQEPFR